MTPSEATELRRRYLWEHPECFVCGQPWIGFGGWLEVHHIVSRRHAGAECLANYAVVCNDLDGGSCHAHYHQGGGHRNGVRLPDLTPGMILWAKRRVDPENWDEALLLGLLRPNGTGWPQRWEITEVPEIFRRRR